MTKSPFKLSIKSVVPLGTKFKSPEEVYGANKKRGGL